jgi:hypothetical protein
MKLKKRGIVWRMLVLFVVLLFINLPLVSALEISNVRVEEINSDSSTILWETDEPADSFVSYGIDKDDLKTIGDSKLIQEHSFPLANLESEKEYFYKVESNELIDDNNGSFYSFMTFAPDTEAPSLNLSLPEIIKGDRIDIKGTTENGAEVKLSVNGEFSGRDIADEGGRFAFSEIFLKGNEANTISLESVDNAGNSESFLGTVFSDLNKPELTLEELPDLVDTPNVPLKGTISEESIIEIFVNDQSIANLEGTEIDTSLSLEEGENKIKIVITDLAGWETVERFAISSDTLPPTINFDLTKGSEYYEGRAETDIKGETESGATVYLYIYRSRVDDYKAKFDKAIDSTTADSEGKFTFSGISFPPPPQLSLESLSPREVPAGLQDVLISPLDQLTQEQRQTYNIYVIAEDASGKSSYSQRQVNVNSCFSGEQDFNIFVNPNFPLQPFRLDPGLMEEGREQIGAVFNISYRGDSVGMGVDPLTGQLDRGYRIQGRPQFVRACTREISEEDDYSLGCKLIKQNLKAQGNADDTAFYVTSTLNRADEFTDREDNIWDDFADKRQLKMPIKVLIKYQERDQYGAWGQAKTQVSCQDLGYFVDIPIDSQEMVPDFLVDYGIPVINETINQIETIKPYLETAIIISGVGCVGSFLTKTATRIYRNFISKYEVWLRSTKEEDEKCPLDQTKYYLDETIEHWQGLKSSGFSGIPDLNKAEHSLDKRCPQTANAWDLEATFDQIYRGFCDRFLCRSVPAGWTEGKEEQDIKNVYNEQLQCSGSSQCVPMRKVENCRNVLKGRSIVNANLIQNERYFSEDVPVECYEDVNGELYYPVGDTSLEENNIWRLRSTRQQPGAIGQYSTNDLLAYKEPGSDSFCVGVDRSCKSTCERKIGYGPATDGLSPTTRRVTSAPTWKAGSQEAIGDFVYTRTGINGVWKSKDNKYYDGEGFEVNQAGTQYLVNGGFVPKSDGKKATATRSKQDLSVWQTAITKFDTPEILKGDGCYKETYENGKVVLQGAGNVRVDETKIRAGYTKDCFIDYDDPQGALYQCVCEKDPESKPNTRGAREAAKEQNNLNEEWFYRQDRVFAESHRSAGTYYPKWRYYDGRDFTAAFGLDWGIDNFLEDDQKTTTRVDPHTQYLGSIQSACLTTINANLNMLQSTLSGLQTCLYEAKYTGEFDAGFCKTLFTQYVCGLIYKGISYLGNECSPLSLKDVGNDYDPSEGGISEFFSAGFGAIPTAMQTSIDEVNNDYGNAKFREFFRTGAQGFTESLCLAAFGYDFPMGLDFIQDAAYAVSTKIDVMFPIAERELATFDPVKGTAVHNYNIGGFMFPGCKIKGYRTELKCIGVEDLGHPGVDDTCGGKGCDCLQATGGLSQPFVGQQGFYPQNQFGNGPGYGGYGSNFGGGQGFGYQNPGIYNQNQGLYQPNQRGFGAGNFVGGRQGYGGYDRFGGYANQPSYGAQSSAYAGQRVHQLDGGTKFGEVTKGQMYDFPIPSPQKIPSQYRYDHVVFQVFLDPLEDSSQCFDNGYQTGNGGIFYFPITDTSSPGVVGCSVHAETGRFICPDLTGFFGGGQTYFEHPFMQCYDKNRDEFVDCQTPNLFLKDDPIIIRPNMFLGGQKACLKITDEKGTELQNFPLPEDVQGPYSRRISLSTVTEDKLNSGGISKMITRPQESDQGCGGHGAVGVGGEVNVITRPPPNQRITSRRLQFEYFPQVSGAYIVKVPAGVVPDPASGFTIAPDRSLIKGGTNTFSLPEINAITFSSNEGFIFSQVLGSPTPTPGANGVCTYQIIGASGSGVAGNLGSMRIRSMLMKPGLDGNCFTATTLFPRSNLGSPIHDQAIRIQLEPVEVQIASDMHNNFLQGNFDLVRGKAEAIINRKDSSLDEVRAIYYHVASLVIQGNGVSTFGGQIKSLLKLFFERDSFGEQLAPFGLDGNGEYDKIKKYLCETDGALNRLEGGTAIYFNNPIYCVSTLPPSTAPSGPKTTCEIDRATTHECKDISGLGGGSSACVANECENTILSGRSITNPNDWLCCPK